MSSDRDDPARATESAARLRVLMDRAARILRSYAQWTRDWPQFHALWTELADDLEDWGSGCSEHGLLQAVAAQPGRTPADAIRALDLALAHAEHLRSDATTETQLLAVLDLKATELETLRALRLTPLSWQWRERIVLAQILRVAGLLLRYSDELHVHLRTLELIQHARVGRHAAL